MTTPTEETTEDLSTRANDGWPSFARRPLLKALSAGAALLFGSGSVTAAGTESTEQESDDTVTRLIHPVYGFPTMDAERIPENLQPDHEVELHRDFPDNPDDPEHPSLFHFEPSGLSVDAGDIVQFTFTHPNHTVTAYHPEHGWQRRVPDGVPPFSSPVVQKDGAWLYRFEKKGVYDMYCGPHSVFGMAMRLVAGDLSEEDVPEYESTFEAEPPLFAPINENLFEQELNATSQRNENVEWTWLTDRKVLDTDVMDPMNIQDAGEVSFQEVTDELGVPFEPDEG